MIFPLVLTHPVSSHAEFEAFLSENKVTLATSESLPQGLFYELTTGDHGCVLNFVPRRNASDANGIKKDAGGNPVFETGEPRLSRFRNAMCMPISISDNDPLPVGQRILGYRPLTK